ncbi:MAG: fibronectin type III domain-containing protein [Lachnospiraceae bacterium]|nr:fibronectin type III domain-containing protein [Lachnospiraceae bacterium]
MGRKQRGIAVFLSLAVLLGSLPAGAGTGKQAKAAGYGLSNPKVKNGVVTWDCIYFGSYWQNDTNKDRKADTKDTKEPIKWRVLSVQGDDALLVSEYNLDCQPYHETAVEKIGDVTWENCSLRGWLNSQFYQNAFSEAEQNAIKETTLVNEGVTGAKYNTVDKVFLLSPAEVAKSAYGFGGSSASETRVAYHTVFTLQAGGAICHPLGSAGWWWLRTPIGPGAVLGKQYSTIASASNVSYYGGVAPGNPAIRDCAVRPAIHLNLSSGLWQKAGRKSAVRTAPAKVKKLKVKKKGKKAVTLSWKKVPGIEGYQIQYSTDKKFKEWKEIDGVGKEKLVKKTKFRLGRLGNKKKQYVRVCAYREAEGRKVCGKWSKVIIVR